MRSISHLAGVKELDNINAYAKEALTEEERQLIEKLNTVVNDFTHERSNVFISFEDLIKLQGIWQKYEHLKPFQFRFDPEKKMPEVFKNRTAFIIWTTWRSRHLVCQDDDVNSGSLAAAKVLSEHKPPFAEETKKETIREFLGHLHPGYGGLQWWTEREAHEFDFWEKEIFPLLEGKREFR